MANFQDNLKQNSLYDNILNICEQNTHILINLINFLVNIDRIMLLQNCFEDKEIMNEVMHALWAGSWGEGWDCGRGWVEGKGGLRVRSRQSGWKRQDSGTGRSVERRSMLTLDSASCDPSGTSDETVEIITNNTPPAANQYTEDVFSR